MDAILTGKITEEEKTSARIEFANADLVKALHPMSNTATPVPQPLPDDGLRTGAATETCYAVGTAENGSKQKGAFYCSRWEKLDVDSAETREGNDAAPAAELSKDAQQKSQTGPTKMSKREKQVHERASQHRLRGNELFKAKQYVEAIEAYTNGIKVYLDTAAPKYGRPNSDSYHISTILGRLDWKPVAPDPALYNNRALCYIHLQQWQNVIDDCSRALELDSTSVKAQWRRAQGYRAVKEFSLANEDAMAVRMKVEEYETAKGAERKAGSRTTVVNPGITMSQVVDFLNVLEEDAAQLAAEERLTGQLEESGTRDMLEGLITTLAEEVAQNGDGSVRLASATLEKLLVREPSLADAFRLFGGFDKLLKQLSPSNVKTVLPILVSASQPSVSNRKEMSRWINIILENLMAIAKPDVGTISYGARLLSICADENVFVNSITRMPKRGKDFGRLLRMFLIQKGDVVTSVAATADLLDFVNKVLACKSVCVHALQKEWEIPLGELACALPTHIAHTAAGGSNDLCLAACRCATMLMEREFAKKQIVVNENFESFTKAVFGTISFIRQNQQRNSPKEFSFPLSAILTAFHNVLLHLAKPTPNILVTHNVVPTLMELFSSKDLWPTLTATLTKLAKHHLQLVADGLDGWWDEVPVKEILTAFVAGKKGLAEMEAVTVAERTSMCSSALQLLAIWLQKGGDRNVAEWKAEGGFTLLGDLLGLYVALDANEFDELLIGNAALCVGECVRKAEQAKVMAEGGLADILIILLRSNEQPLYKIHYKGWAPKWDDLVDGSRILKLNNDNLDLAVRLEMEVAGKKGEKRKSLGTVGPSLKNLLEGGRRKGKSIVKDDDTEELSASFKIDIPPNLLAVLQEDGNMIREDKLVPLPRTPNIRTILSSYRTFALESAPPPPGGLDALDSVITGLQTYFEAAIGTVLLYQNERQQHNAVSRKLFPNQGPRKRTKGDIAAGKNIDLTQIKGETVSDVYGAEHLLRLFVPLPVLLTRSGADDETVDICRAHFDYVLRYLDQNRDTLFLEAYET
ncbi:Esa1p-associated factor [Rhizophlyctis rosea]|uniref:Chromatin modification-related protein EAF3 n=1 Tax=Rhizophlyctis rosea TaxID=64517 RepID=A0AAD5X3W1_9FUNG|nr:Esa1p-associated factor [Rhizophlyctis rosea]